MLRFVRFIPQTHDESDKENVRHGDDQIGRESGEQHRNLVQQGLEVRSPHAQAGIKHEHGEEEQKQRDVDLRLEERDVVHP